MLEASYLFGAFLPALFSLPWKSLRLGLLSSLEEEQSFKTFHLGQIVHTFFGLISQRLSINGFFCLLKKYCVTLLSCLLCYLINKYLLCLIQVKVSSVCVLAHFKLCILCIMSARKPHLQHIPWFIFSMQVIYKGSIIL